MHSLGFATPEEEAVFLSMPDIRAINAMNSNRCNDSHLIPKLLQMSHVRVAGVWGVQRKGVSFRSPCGSYYSTDIHRGRRHERSRFKYVLVFVAARRRVSASMQNRLTPRAGFVTLQSSDGF